MSQFLQSYLKRAFANIRGFIRKRWLLQFLQGLRASLKTLKLTGQILFCCFFGGLAGVFVWEEVANGLRFLEATYCGSHLTLGKALFYKKHS